MLCQFCLCRFLWMEKAVVKLNHKRKNLYHINCQLYHHINFLKKIKNQIKIYTREISLGKLIGSKIPKIHLFSLISIKILEVADQYGSWPPRLRLSIWFIFFTFKCVISELYISNVSLSSLLCCAFFFRTIFLSHCWFYHIYALVLLNNAIYVNLAWNFLTETLAFPSLFSGNIKESHFPFAHLLRHLLLCPGKTFINIHLLSLPAYNIRYPTK